MRLEKEAPQTQFEIEVENILVENGYNRNDIQFRDDNRYLRVGYWRYLSDKALDQLAPYIKEVVDIDDDDCGTLWFYRLNH
jgi:hypothetical protein